MKEKDFHLQLNILIYEMGLFPEQISMKCSWNNAKFKYNMNIYDASNTSELVK